MRAIIIIQAIIIILGAYYFYMQSQEKVVEPVTTSEQPVVAPTVREGYMPPTENPPSTSEIDASTSASGVTGHSDVGMEYPIMDEGMEVR